ncbi:UNVERIFIED_CONTAM: hypothetical protein Sradi_5349400 [Sesamum radiatum]|uniref:Uncharacterized protein n=1 Tax=Sesamum radiatum TaxID=300843 RepID=A0AAW2LP03_SESRA
MEPPPVQTTPSIDEDEWDTDGFVIPSLGIEDQEQNSTDSPRAEDSKLSEVKDPTVLLHLKRNNKSITLLARFKQKLKEADRRYGGTGRENKVDNLRELVGGGKMPLVASKSSPREWLDPHCHESEFERRHLEKDQ